MYAAFHVAKVILAIRDDSDETLEAKCKTVCF